MRNVYPINQGWTLQKGGEPAVTVNLPHCYNAADGQDGSLMYRGEAIYSRTWTLSPQDMSRMHYLEVGAAALCSKVYVNGTLCRESSCGFALYRVPLDSFIHEGENVIEITVSNGVNGGIYPAMADFSFYGGLYRGVSIISDERIHFDEMDDSRDGILVEAKAEADGSGSLNISANICAEQGGFTGTVCKVRIEDAKGQEAACAQADAAETVSFGLHIPEVHLWDGLRDPYLYTAVITLCDGDTVYDERRLSVGFRTISYDSRLGFQLNGRPYQLHGVARHQDFGDIGNAITRKELETDLKLILGMGANAVRCSHYQHCEEWYELCDRAGLLVWAEIPVISRVAQNPEADQNAMKQLELLISQARSHCSIFCWGVQNEVCMVSKNQYTFDLVERLGKRAKELDPSRMTAQANEYTTEDDCPILKHTDILGFNLYYGWYYGRMEDLQDRLDGIHARNPEKPVILTEYGVDTNPKYHSAAPKADDYSEEYQLLFCENALRAMGERPWMAGGFAWNMFDFGSAGRDEGGKKGQNQKGLVTIDRKLKKDVYYLYKAFWSKKPFVYLAGRRFLNRCQEKTSITVLTNMERIRLAVNGAIAAERTGGGPMQVFEDIVLRPGENTVSVFAQNPDGISRTDAISLCRTEEPDPEYAPPVKREEDGVANWFEGLDITELSKESSKELESLRPEGFTFDDTVQDVFACPEAKAVFMKYLRPVAENPRMEGCMEVTLHRLMGFVRRMNIPEEVKRQCERELNKIDKNHPCSV